MNNYNILDSKLSVIERINKIIPLDETKKVIIFGIGYIGIHGILLLKKLGKKVSYIIDNDESKVGSSYLGVEVKNPYELLYENWDDVLVFICAGGKRAQEMADMLEGMGGVFNQNYFRVLSEERYEPANMIDPILGYSRGERGFKEIVVSNQEMKLDEENEVKILVLGGSTTDYSLYGIKSWSFFLKELLDKDGISNQVINGGVCGYNSSQEMLKLLGEGIDRINPDIVISYSGFNDSCPSKYPLVHDNYVEVLETLWNCYKNNVGDIDDIYFGEMAYDSVIRYIKNMRIMHSVCEEFDIKFIGILQPTMVTGKCNIDETEREYLQIEAIKNKVNKSLEFYKVAKDKIKEFPWIWDFTSIFDGEEDCFYEWVHCNEKGNQIIANNIYKILEHIIKEQ